MNVSWPDVRACMAAISRHMDGYGRAAEASQHYENEAGRDRAYSRGTHIWRADVDLRQPSEERMLSRKVRLVSGRR